jgi:hypothetical protein
MVNKNPVAYPIMQITVPLLKKCRWFIRRRRTCQPTNGKSAATGGIQEFKRKEFGQ